MEEDFRIALNDPSLVIVTSLAWGSQNPQHRELIYSALDQRLSKGSFYCSISHAPEMGGFAISKYPVGFDIEITSRVTEPTVRRISKDQEVSISPSFASLWCAKEATFKALKNFKQPPVVSQIEIQFEPTKPDSLSRFHHFTVPNEQNFSSSHGVGATFSLSEFTYCVLIFRP